MFRLVVRHSVEERLLQLADRWEGCWTPKGWDLGWQL